MIDFYFQRNFLYKKKLIYHVLRTHKSLFELKFDFMMNFFIDTL